LQSIHLVWPTYILFQLVHLMLKQLPLEQLLYEHLLNVCILPDLLSLVKYTQSTLMHFVNGNLGFDDGESFAHTPQEFTYRSIGHMICALRSVKRSTQVLVPILTYLPVSLPSRYRTF
jgi:hypothetical protein